jgi:hypothetical protein
MKIFLSFFVIFFLSFDVSALTICINDSHDPDSCVDEGGSQGDSIDGVDCYYNKDTATTQCNTVLGDGSLGGYWDSKTSSCSNFVAPVVGSTGEITCPASQPVSIKSKTTPNPSKNDVACDPSKGADSGCASQDTAIKTNDLLSEANSKLGSIAGSNAANAGFLAQILGTLRGIASQGTVSDGNGNGDGDGDGDGDGISTDTTQISKISVDLSLGVCPSAVSFNIAGASYEFSYDSICDIADSFHDIVVSMGALSALMIVVTAL